jgi:hypothetical protein
MLKRFFKAAQLRLSLPALIYLLAACGGGTTGASPTPTPVVRDTPAAAPTQPALPTAIAAPTAVIPPAATTQAGAANVLIGYHKSGGIAGIDETLTVYADGTTELRGKAGTVKAQADPGTIQALQKLLASPEFAALQMPVQPPAPDQFVYELTLPGRAEPLVATDSADNPPVLRELIDLLEQLKTPAR